MTQSKTTTRVRRTSQTKLLRVESMEMAGQTELLEHLWMIYRPFALFNHDCTSCSSGSLAYIENAFFWAVSLCVLWSHIGTLDRCFEQRLCLLEPSHIQSGLSSEICQAFRQLSRERAKAQSLDLSNMTRPVNLECKRGKAQSRHYASLSASRILLHHD